MSAAPIFEVWTLEDLERITASGGRVSQPAAHNFSTIEPEILDEDMRPSDLVFALKHLHFGRSTKNA
jgi:hypothetical protein